MEQPRTAFLFGALVVVVAYGIGLSPIVGRHRIDLIADHADQLVLVSALAAWPLALLGTVPWRWYGGPRRSGRDQVANFGLGGLLIAFGCLSALISPAAAVIHVAAGLAALVIAAIRLRGDHIIEGQVR